MNALDVLDSLRKRGVVIWAEQDVVRYDAPKGVVTPADLEAMRAHKDEILRLLGVPHHPKTVNAPPEWHAEEVARCVEQEGVCIFWSEVLGDLVAFVKDGAQAPAGVVAFTTKELAMLFLEGRPDPDPHLLRMVYQAKRLGGARVTGCDEGAGA